MLYKPGDWLFSGLKRFDLATGATQRHEYGPNRYGSEPQMARRVGATAEDDGYLIAMVANMDKNRGEVLILDASDISRAPLATIILPERMSVGTHACWVEGDRLQGEARDPAMVPTE